MNFIESLLTLDRELFLILNSQHSPLMDEVMFFVSKVWVWIPLYLLVILYIAKRWKKESIWIILSIVLCLVATDQLTNLTKELFQRLRPSHAPDLAGLVHHVNGYMGGKFGFVSGHASNSFGFAMISALIMKNNYYTMGIFAWAGVVAYSRIYLGVHYPLDILGGMLLGMLLAGIIFNVMNRFQRRLMAEIKSRFF